MATSSAEEKREHSDFSAQEGEDQEEEALSLCDLPVNRMKEENNQSSRHPEARQGTETNQEDFDFGPWCGDGYLSKKSDMCAADDIFFQGQILPLRLSFSSESGGNKFESDSSLNPSRSASTDHNSTGVFTTFSGMSSSSRSHYSSSSSNNTSSAIASTGMIKPKIQNQFLTHRSPKPQIRLSSTSLGNAACNRPRNSSFWDFFRLGLIRTPEIELQDLKVRNSVSRNSSSSSSKSNSSIKKCGKINVSSDSSKSGCKIKNMSRHNSNDCGKNMEKRRKQSYLQKKEGLLSGCSCSVSAVKPFSLNIDALKSSNDRSRSAGNDINDKSERGSIEEKLQELKMKRRIVKKQLMQQQGKQAMSRHRTFEWIKELPHATSLDHQKEAI